MPAKAGKVAADNGIGEALTDFDALIQRDLDVVSICTPSALHFGRQARRLPPAATSSWKSRSPARSPRPMRWPRSSSRAAAGCSPVFQYRFADGLAQLLHLRELGLVGKAYAATVETHWRRLPAYYDNPWRGRWATELGGCLITHAIHNHDMLTHVIGPVRSVYARTATRVNPIETEDCAGRRCWRWRTAPSPRCR